MSSHDQVPDEEVAAYLPATPTIDLAKAKTLFSHLVQQQNLPLAIMAGFVAAVGGGLAWAVVTILIGLQVGWMAVGIGLLVGFSVRYFGKGLTKSFGYAGGSLSLFGCLLGNFLAICGLVAKNAGQPIIATTLAFAADPFLSFELIKATFSPLDWLFYGIAVYEGFKFSFRQIDDEELNSMLS